MFDGAFIVIVKDDLQQNIPKKTQKVHLSIH